MAPEPGPRGGVGESKDRDAQPRFGKDTNTDPQQEYDDAIRELDEVMSGLRSAVVNPRDVIKEANRAEDALHRVNARLARAKQALEAARA